MGFQITRGDPGPTEPLWSIAERLYRAGAVKLEDRPNGGFQWTVTENNVPFRVMANSHGRALCCQCGGAVLHGLCLHKIAVQSWLREHPE